MMKYLHTPFPRPKNSRKNIFWLFLVGAICSVFILVFKPFNIKNETGEFYVYLLLFNLGMVFFFSIYLMEFLVPSILSKWFKKWTLGKAIIWYAWMILFVGAVMFLYKSYLGGFRDFTIKEYLFVCARVLGIGLTVSFFVLGIISYLNKKQFALLSAKESFLVTSPDAKPIRLYLDEVLFIESDDNYVDIHLLKHGKRTKEIFRSSLKNMEEQLVYMVSPIYRCHRKFLININCFEIHKMNSRSMSILLKNGDDMIPVSKQYMEQIYQMLKIRP